MLLQEILGGDNRPYDKYTTGRTIQTPATRKNRYDRRRISRTTRNNYTSALRSGGQLEWMKDRIEAFINEYGCAKASKLIQKWYDEDRIDEETARELLDFCDANNPNHTYGDRQRWWDESRVVKYKLD